MNFIRPKEVTIKDSEGGERTYTLSILPYPVGRKVAAIYPVANAPKVGNYAQSEEVMRDMFKFIQVNLEDGRLQPLSTLELIATYSGCLRVRILFGLQTSCKLLHQ